MSLTIDLTAANRRVSDEDFHDWAQGQTVFLSSVMGELAAERRTVAAALEDAGFTVRWFEDFGGRDDSADVAYLTEVAAADIYVGVLGDDYGAMQKASGYSATHEEFLEARRRGKRVTFWARQDGSDRQGNARRFLDDVQVFNVTGGFDSGDDLAAKLLRRLREMAAEDLSPWVKVGDIVFRAESITDSGVELRIEALVRDAAVMTGLRALQPDPKWGTRGADVPITYGDRSGTGRVTAFTVQTRSSATQQVSLTIEVRWAGGRDSMASGINGLSHEDVVEAGIRASLFGEALPQQLRSFGWGAADGPDPLAQLQGVQLAEGSVSPVARLLTVEQLVGTNRVAAIEDFALGPILNGQRRLRVGWREHEVYTDHPAGHRVVEGERPW